MRPKSVAIMAIISIFTILIFVGCNNEPITSKEWVATKQQVLDENYQNSILEKSRRRHHERHRKIQNQLEQQEREKLPQYNTYKNKERDKEIIRSIRYIQDSRTGLCFAYHLNNYDEKGFEALTLIPCKSVPSDILTIGGEPLPVEKN